MNHRLNILEKKIGIPLKARVVYYTSVNIWPRFPSGANFAM
jgi:hypothetical protein